MFSKLRPLILAAPLFALAGCSIQPGDYIVFRVAFDAPENQSDCLNGNDPNPNTVDDSTDLTTASSIAIFAFDDDYFLEYGEGLSLQGVRDGSDYSFDGTTVDVEVLNPDDDTYTTNTVDIEVDLIINGKNINGIATTRTTNTCTGASCPEDYDTTCTSTQRFRGSEIKDADLERPV
ncbi:hypothetical protein PPSIR1_33576 [Plesiocystis pacifica SIR-1]|uniref:Lipoprotein n=1 Tax=Plesiocystis pacifica SIR-1 TaxID=391625 RepID=A6GE59_9BACT|nr:hypothetical protein [Plesiocystis pacifica]EDM75850.1 hypothetical protein PPSIR1_33576 [Plesiocystis pacifica SIR-1]